MVALGLQSSYHLTHFADLGVIATVAAMKQIDLDPKLVEDVVFGNVSQTAVDTPYRKQALFRRVARYHFA